jgi:predicted metal-dependent hydrolase
MDPNSKPEVEIRSSARRRKTGVAYWEGGRVVVVVPERMSRSTRDSFADQLVDQLLRRSGRRHASDAGLADRAAELADRYLDGVRPASIRWSTRQQRRWGSCSLHSREIRIAARLQTVPEWVLDGVIVHELSHLLEAGHTSRFHELANRYPRQGEAHTYLEGFGHGLTTAGFPVRAEEDIEAQTEPAAADVAACAWNRTGPALQLSFDSTA